MNPAASSVAGKVQSKANESHPSAQGVERTTGKPADAGDNPHARNKPDKSTRNDRPDLVRALESEGAHARERLTRKQERHDNPASSSRPNTDASDRSNKGHNKTRNDASESQFTANDARGAHGNRPERAGQRSENSPAQDVHGKFKWRENEGGNPRAANNERGQGANSLGNNKTVSVSDLLKFVRGESDRGHDQPHLPRELRTALDAARSAVGSDALNGLLKSARGEKIEKFAAQFVKHVEQFAERATGRPGNAPKEVIKQSIDDLVGVVKLVKHFAELEKNGAGKIVQRAEERALRFLYNEARRDVSDGRRDRPVNNSNGFFSPAPHVVRPSELLRDLRSGLFLPEQETRNPFPLTGRARIAGEMMELMRTLDRVEQFAAKLQAHTRSPGSGGMFPGLGELSGAEISAATSGGDLEGLLMLLPGLPGSVGRATIERFIAALGGQLIDARGQTLLGDDGLPLKLDQMLWLSATGGLAPGQAAEGELASTRLSPLLVHGFDALYSLIGFDGRTLNAPRYAVVQVQINGSELEWVFGQPPLSEGWARALIERLKDSRIAEHNYLGEMLEEALVERRFHSVLLSGTVAEGVAVEDSYNVTRLLPVTSGDFHAPEFAPA